MIKKKKNWEYKYSLLLASSYHLQNHSLVCINYSPVYLHALFFIYVLEIGNSSTLCQICSLCLTDLDSLAQMCKKMLEEFRYRKLFYSYLAHSAPIISTNYLIVHMNAEVHENMFTCWGVTE